MPKFPEPPSPEVLRSLTPDLRTLDAGSELWRLYFKGGKYPTLWEEFRSFGPVATSRFDHHQPPPQQQERAILYTAAHGPTCIAEVFQDSRLIDRRARDPWLVGFRLAAPLCLLDLSSTWPTRAGASMVIGSGPRGRARRWSRAIYEAYPSIQGLLYPSSMHANRPVLALYEQAKAAIPEAPIFHRPLDDPALLALLKKVAWEIGYGLV